MTGVQTCALPIFLVHVRSGNLVRSETAVLADSAVSHVEHDVEDVAGVDLTVSVRIADSIRRGIGGRSRGHSCGSGRRGIGRVGGL